MRVSVSMIRLVRSLKHHNWPDAQIRALLANVPMQLVDQLLTDAEVAVQ